MSELPPKPTPPEQQGWQRYINYSGNPIYIQVGNLVPPGYKPTGDLIKHGVRFPNGGLSVVCDTASTTFIGGSVYIPRIGPVGDSVPIDFNSITQWPNNP